MVWVIIGFLASVVGNPSRFILISIKATVIFVVRERDLAHLEKSHGFDVIAFIKREAVIDSSRENK